MTPALGLVIVAAGSSTRMDGIDKVWTPLAGRPLIWHSLETLSPHADETVLVVRGDALDRARAELLSRFPELKLVPGGAQRRDSVVNGLRAVSCEQVAVHDAARPLASPRLLQAGRAYLGQSGGAIPAEPVRDTVKRVSGDVILETLDRSSLRLAQTPQLFHTQVLLHAHEVAADRELTDDASALEVAGYPAVVFPGEPWNIKITTQYDLALAELVLDRQLAS